MSSKSLGYIRVYQILSQAKGQYVSLKDLQSEYNLGEISNGQTDEKSVFKTPSLSDR